jgi:hypothetical protein
MNAAVQAAVDETGEAERECESWRSLDIATSRRTAFGTHVTNAENQIKSVIQNG